MSKSNWWSARSHRYLHTLMYRWCKLFRNGVKDAGKRISFHDKSTFKTVLSPRQGNDSPHIWFEHEFTHVKVDPFPPFKADTWNLSPWHWAVASSILFRSLSMLVDPSCVRATLWTCDILISLINTAFKDKRAYFPSILGAKSEFIGVSGSEMCYSGFAANISIDTPSWGLVHAEQPTDIVLNITRNLSGNGLEAIFVR